MTAATKPYALIVQQLIDIIDANDWQDKFDAAIQMAGKYKIGSLKQIDNREAYYKWVDGLYRWVPTEIEDAKNVFNHICEFYFILDQAPVKALQNQISPQNTDEPLTELSQWIVDFAKAWGEWMDTTDSITPESIRSFQAAPNYKMNEYMPPPSGYKTFNQMFARHIKPGMRPIAAIGDERVVVSAADSTIVGSWQVNQDNTVHVPLGKVAIKHLDWSMDDLLHESPYRDRFKGGLFVHGFLNTTDYHRLHVPVSGEVLEARVIQGQAYLDVATIKIATNLYALRGKRTFNAGDDTSYQFAQTRGLIVIDSPFGLVAVLPIGMAQVSSVVMTAEVGRKLHKGEEFGYFQFGGSDHVVLFEASVNVKLTAQVNVHYNQGSRIGYASP